MSTNLVADFIGMANKAIHTGLDQKDNYVVCAVECCVGVQEVKVSLYLYYSQ